MRTESLALLCLLIGGVAHAEPAKPWAEGVSQAEQEAALELYRLGNAEFVESRYSQALVKYREALVHWDHPGIRFNTAVCLINLEQPIEALEHLERALRYGEAALGSQAYAEALAYRENLVARLGRIEVSCPGVDARVTLDGQPLLDCPGKATRYVTPGKHQVVGRRPGVSTFIEDLTAVEGRASVVTVVFGQGATSPPAPELPAPSPRSRVPLVVGVAGASAIVVGAASHLFYFRPARDELADSITRAEYADRGAAFDRSRGLTIGLYAVGTLGLATAAILHLTVFRRTETSLRVVPSSGGAVVGLEWRQ